jgi:hypothetical protein
MTGCTFVSSFAECLTSENRVLQTYTRCVKVESIQTGNTFIFIWIEGFTIQGSRVLDTLGGSGIHIRGIITCETFIGHGVEYRTMLHSMGFTESLGDVDPVSC